MMQSFALWLCSPGTAGAHINQHSLQPPVLASEVEANWLWHFLQRVDIGQPLLSHAQTVAEMSAAEKADLASWIQAVTELAAHFQPAPPQWPVNRPAVSDLAWKAFKTLMEAFYDKGFRTGLPYRSDGTPTAGDGVNYAHFVREFRDAHRQNPDPDAREVCVLCGGPLGQIPEVDHWIAKNAFPLLSICANNLLPICSECNSTTNKGQKPVHSNGSFTDWFHPHLRQGNLVIQMNYELHPGKSVNCGATTAADQHKAANLDSLLNLSPRWTREFKAEYKKQQDVLAGRTKRRLEAEQPVYTQAEILSYVQAWKADLLANQPHHEVHQTLATALEEPARLAAWHRELNLVRRH
jgi:hypothetical protein